MPISYDLKTVFVHIPKTGGQSVSALLGITKGSIANFYYEGRTHLTLPMIKEMQDVEGYYAFTFVRNPYNKIISEYNWRMRNIHSVVYNEPTRERMSFTEYMETLLQRWDNLVPAWREKAHVMPQVSFLEPGMDVFRFERFEEDCEELKSILGIDRKTPHVNIGSYKTKHTPRTIEITRMLYEEDFKALGYDINSIP